MSRLPVAHLVVGRQRDAEHIVLVVAGHGLARGNSKRLQVHRHIVRNNGCQLARTNGRRQVAQGEGDRGLR